MSLDKCSAYIYNLDRESSYVESVICANGWETNSTLCNGDSGGNFVHLIDSSIEFFHYEQFINYV